MPHYFDPSPGVTSIAETVTVALPDVTFRLRTDRGVFSHGRLDAGTAVLLRAALGAARVRHRARPRLRQLAPSPRRSRCARPV